MFSTSPSAQVFHVVMSKSGADLEGLTEMISFVAVWKSEASLPFLRWETEVLGHLLSRCRGESQGANGESTMRDPLQRPELTEVLGCWGRADSQAGKWCGEELGHPTSALGAAGCRVKTRC